MRDKTKTKKQLINDFITERKQTEEALRESEERFRVIAETTPIPMVISRVSDGMILYANTQAGPTFGLTPETLIGRKTPDFYYDPADRQGVLDTLAQKGFVHNYEIQAKKADGRPFWVAVSIQPLTFKGERALLSALYDITQRKRVEEALAEERNLLRTLIDNLPDYIYVKDTESRFVISNMALVRLMGATAPDEVIGKADLDFFPEELARQYYADEQELMRSGQPLVNREEPTVDQMTGERKWVSTTKVPLRDNQGKIVGLVGMTRDITERKRVEEALRQYQDQLEALVEERTAELSTANQQLQREIIEGKRIAEALRVEISQATALYRVSRSAELEVNLKETLASLFTGVLQTGTGVDAIFAINDEMALSAAATARAMGREKIIIAGYDASEKGLVGLNAGKIAATVTQHLVELGRRGVIAALQALEGLPIGPEILVPVHLITPNTKAITVKALEIPKISRPYTLGVALGDFEANVGYRDMREGVLQAAKGAGIELILAGHHETLVQEQAAAVQKMIERDVDALIVVPLNEYTLSPVVQRALDLGIPVIALDQQIAGVDVTAYVSSDNLGGGSLAATFIAQQLGGVGRAAVIYSDMYTSRLRRQGFEEEMIRSFPSISIVPYRVLTSDYEMGEMAFLSMLQWAEMDRWWVALTQSPDGDNDVENVILHGAAGYYPELSAELMRYQVHQDTIIKDIAAQCLIERRYLVINDPLEGERSLFGLRGDGRRACGKYVIAPMMTEGQQITGVICIGRAMEGMNIGRHDIQLAEALSSHTAVMIRNYLLLEERKQSEEALRKAKEAAEAANRELSRTLDWLQATQSQLVGVEKMAALGGLVAGIAHEINTPIGVGVTAASLLEEKSAMFHSLYQNGQMKRSDLEKYLDLAEQSSQMILTNLNRAAELIHSFKQVAVDQSSEERRVFPVKAYLDEILLSLHPRLKRTQLSLEIHVDDNLTLDSYPGVLAQIVTNLVMNSLLHAYEPGEPGRLVFNLKQQDNHFIFVYSDDGRGIPKEYLGKIFDPFFTTKRGQGGSGLGLHIIYNLVTQKLGGTIRCESMVGLGTKFVIEAPISVG